ncbi:MAG: cytochrome c-type biogenesis protein [Bacillota bacterium]
MRFLRALLLALLVVSFVSHAALAAGGPMQPPKEHDRSTRFIEEDLLCQCGCTMGVAVCDCGTAGEMRENIARMLGEGQTKAQILAFYVAEYGEKVLTAPTKRGFNLSAWITPFAVLLIGLAFLYWLVRNWVRQFRATVAVAGPGEAEEPAELSEEEQAYSDKIREILRRHY